MNAERLLALFERISEAPDAIPRLRRFILDLAVRGKLVEQDPEDEPVAEVLRRINIERSVKGDFPIPSAWEWVAVGAVSESRLGKMLDKGKNKGVERPYLRNLNVRWFDFDLSDLLEMRFEDSELPEYALKRGDVLICEGGEPGRAAVWDERIEGVYFQKAIHRARFCAFVDSVYFVYVLRASADDGRLSSYFTGTGISHFTGRGLKSYRFPLPPLAEQHRIVAKIDELMTLCDQLEAARAQRVQCRERLVAASLQRLNQPSDEPEAFRSDARFALQVLPSLTTTLAQIKQLRQTILNLAVRGKLVEQDPEDEPADVWLVQIQRALSSTIASMGLRLKRSSSSPAASPEGDFAGVPSSWGLSTLGSLAIVLDPNPSHRYPSYDGGTVPILSTQEFSGLDGWNPSTAKLVPHSFFEYQQANCRFEQGDIVFARKGRLGLPRFLPDFEQFTFSHTVFLVKPMPGISPEYLLWLLRRDQVITWLTNEMNANTGVPTLGKEKMERLPIPLPPLAEQHRIVAKVDELMALCDQLEQQLSQGEESRRGLLEAVLHEALAAPSSPPSGIVQPIH